MNYDVSNNQNTNNQNMVPNSNITPNVNPLPNNSNIGAQPQNIVVQSPVNSVSASNMQSNKEVITPNNVQNPQVMNNVSSNNVNTNVQSPMNSENTNVQNSNVVNNSAVANQNIAKTTTPQDKIKVIINGLFNFGNIKKVFKYNWGSIIDDTLPKDTKAVIDKESYNNIFYGGILKTFADILAIIFSICMVYVIDTLDPARISGLRTLGLNNDVGLTAFIPIVITLLIFTYNSAIGYQKQKTTFHFAFIWLVLLSIIFSLVKLISYVATIFIAPLYALLGFISFFLSLLGDVHVIVGCVDFCQRVTHDYIEAHTVVPVQEPITTTRINVDDVSDHNNKTCSYCASQNPKDATICSNCGKNI